MLCGHSSPARRLVFAGFALGFFALRVGLNSVCTFLFLREVRRTFVAPSGSHLLYTPAEQVSAAHQTDATRSRGAATCRLFRATPSLRTL